MKKNIKEKRMMKKFEIEFSNGQKYSAQCNDWKMAVKKVIDSLRDREDSDQYDPTHIVSIKEWT